MSLLLIALFQFIFFLRNVISTCSTTSNVEFSFYGYPDGNSDTTSFGCSGTQQIADGTAGGDGSYAHPETFATALNNPNFVPCEIVYIPLFQKYFQYMDHCEYCMQIYPQTTRIDLWIGSDVNGGQNQILCEDTFGIKEGQTIVRNPPSNLKVNSGQLWDNDSGTCGDDSFVFPNYSTDEAELCGSRGDGSSSSPGTSTPPLSLSSSSSVSSTPPPAASTPSTPPNSSSEKVNVVEKAANVKANVKPQDPTTLKTVVSSSASSTAAATTFSTPLSSVISHSVAVASPSPSSSSSSSTGTDCGVTAQWPTPWLGHCVGAPCHEFNDCSGELICQGWPNAVCTKPSGGK